MAGEFQDYRDGETVCEAYVAHPGRGNRPAVLVAHQWAGQGAHERATADRLAALGYAGIAIDVYGKGRRGESGTPTAMAINSALMMPFREDRAMLKARLLAAVDFARGIEGVDAGRIAIMGYCFGGLCALDVARAGAEGVKGAISIHGVFAAPEICEQRRIDVSILILHGWEDPMAPPKDVEMVAKELTDAGADWQLHAYGHAMHSFTHHDANMPERGQQYNARADARSWASTVAFLGEIFG